MNQQEIVEKTKSALLKSLRSASVASREVTRLTILILFLSCMGCATNQKPDEGPQQTVLANGKRHIKGCPRVKPELAKDGKVKMLIDVDKDGKAYNIRIIESEPKGVWDDNAICITQLNNFKKNDKGEAPPFKDFRHEIKMKINQ